MNYGYITIFLSFLPEREKQSLAELYGYSTPSVVCSDRENRREWNPVKRRRQSIAKNSIFSHLTIAKTVWKQINKDWRYFWSDFHKVCLQVSWVIKHLVTSVALATYLNLHSIYLSEPEGHRKKKKQEVKMVQEHTYSANTYVDDAQARCVNIYIFFLTYRYTQ